MTYSKKTSFLVVFFYLISGVVSIIYECRCNGDSCHMTLEESDNCSSTGTSDLTLPAELFVTTKQRIELFVRKLNLRSTSNQFQNQSKALKKIVGIDLSDNQLSVLQANEFSATDNVEELNIGNNQLRIVDENAFSGLIRLEILYLGSNQLAQIWANSFAQLQNLHTLYLTNNILRTLDACAFTKAKNLKYLYLQFNTIREIEPCPLESGVRGLFLEGNQLTDIDNFTNFAKNLIKVDLTWNLNLKFTERSFKGWYTLENLTIDNIDLKGSQQFPESLSKIDDLRRLREISMSGNKLETLAIADFPQLLNLVTLRIHNNELTEIDLEELKVKFRNLHQITIAGNQWNCSFLQEMLDDFKQRRITILDMDKIPSCAGTSIHMIVLVCLGVTTVFIGLTLYIIQAYAGLCKTQKVSN